jgi:translation initiation factor 3 subunit B
MPSATKQMDPQPTEDGPDFSDLIEKYQVVPEIGYSNMVCIDNAPIVDDKKEEKLIAVIKKIFKNVGTIVEDGIYMPKENGKSKGYSWLIKIPLHQVPNGRNGKLGSQRRQRIQA